MMGLWVNDSFDALCYLRVGAVVWGMKKSSGTPVAPFQLGQVWQLEDSSVQIGLVGKMLVHYKQFKGKKPIRVPTSLAGIGQLQKYLRQKKAVLLPQ